MPYRAVTTGHTSLVMSPGTLTTLERGLLVPHTISVSILTRSGDRSMARHTGPSSGWAVPTDTHRSACFGLLRASSLAQYHTGLSPDGLVPYATGLHHMPTLVWYHLAAPVCGLPSHVWEGTGEAQCVPSPLYLERLPLLVGYRGGTCGAGYRAAWVDVEHSVSPVCGTVWRRVADQRVLPGENLIANRVPTGKSL